LPTKNYHPKEEVDDDDDEMVNEGNRLYDLN
jgi:hypothetical protein